MPRQIYEDFIFKRMIDSMHLQEEFFGVPGRWCANKAKLRFGENS